jgi:WD40 repeat protein
VFGVAFSPDGEYIVAGDEGGFVHLISKETGEAEWTDMPKGSIESIEEEEAEEEEEERLPYEDSIQGVAFSPDGEYIVAGDWHGFVYLISKETEETIWVHTKAKNTVEKVTFSPDGKYVAVHGGADSVYLISRKTGKTKWVYNEDTHDVAFSPDGEYIVAGGLDGRKGFMHLISKETGEAEWVRRVEDCVFSVAFSRDGKYMAAGGDRFVYLFQRQKMPPRHELVPEPNQVESMVYGYIVGHGGEIDIEECARKLKLSEEDVELAIKALVKKGKLEHD